MSLVTHSWGHSKGRPCHAFEWISRYVKYFVKSLEIKTNAEVFFKKNFVSTLLPSTTQDGMDGKRLKLAKIAQSFQVLKRCMQKITNILMRIAFPGKVNLIVFLVYKECCCF